MKKTLKKAFRLTAAVFGVLVLIAVAAVIILVFDKPLVGKILKSQLEKRTGMAVRIGRLDYSISPFRVAIDSLEFSREDAFEKLTATVEHFKGEGNFWKFVGSAKPAFDSIEIGNVTFRLEWKKSSEGPPDIEGLLRQAADALAWTKQVSAGDVNIFISFTGREMGLDIHDCSLTSADAARNVAYSIKRGNLRVRNKNGAFLLRSGLVSSGTLGSVPPHGFKVEFVFPSMNVMAGGIESSFAGVAADLAGRFDGSARTLEVSRLKIGVPGLLDLDGTVAGRYGGDAFLEAEARVRFESLESAAGLLKSRLPPEFRGTGLRGRAELTGKYGFRRSKETPGDNVDASLVFENVEIDPVVGGLPLHLRVAGRINAAGPSLDPRFTADINSSVGRIVRDGLAVTGSEVHVAAAASKSEAVISRFDARLDGLAFKSRGGEKISLDKAVLTGTGRADLRRKTAALSSLEIAVTNLEAAAGDEGVSSRKAVLTVTGSFDLDRKKASLTMREAILTGLDIATGSKKISFDEAAFTGKGSFNDGEKTARLESFEARFPGLPPLRMTGRLDIGGSGAAEIRVDGRGLDLPALRKIAAPFVPESLAGWELGGTADFSLSARRPALPGEDWGLSGTVSLAGVRFNDPTFSIAGESLDPVIKFEIARAASKSFSFDGSLDVGRGEALWKSVYIPWNTHPLHLTISGCLDSDSGAVEDLTARLLLPTIGEVGVAGSVKIGPVPVFDLRTDARLKLEPLYSLRSAAGAAAEDRMKLEGTLGASLSVRKDAGPLSLSGRVTLADTNVHWPASKTDLLGVTADLPVHFEFETGAAGGRPSDAALPEEGHLRFGEFRNPFLTLKTVAVSVHSGVNAFAVEPLGLDLYGGRVELGRTLFRVDPSSGSFQGLGSLVLRDLDISLFPIPSPLLKLTGKVRADFPELDIGPRKIEISGRGEADIFGGQVVLRDLAVSDPLDPGRSISLNVDLVDLDLKKLTDEIPFGEVTGIVRGEIRGLVITYMQPERFDLHIESVPRKGTAQTFSLKAVDNLTILSSGQPSSIGTSRFWMRYVRGFRYKKLGLVSTLRNDTFTLSGTIHQGGLEYLVKKPLLFGINVINRMPGKLISFKDMTERLKRIGQSQK